MHALRGVTSSVMACALIMVALAITSLHTSIGGLSCAVSNAAFGGTAEYAALWFKSARMGQNFYGYVTAMAVLTFVVAWKMPDPQKSGMPA